MRTKSALLVASVFIFNSLHASEVFTFDAAGQLPTGTGEGYVEEEYRGPHIQNLRFPLEAAPAFANSQVYASGGSHPPSGSKGGQCTAANYIYPWRDNFCEKRSNPRQVAALCPRKSAIHMGQDIRPATCKDKEHWVVAPEAGTITRIGAYSVRLRGTSGYEHMFLHMANDTIVVSKDQKVTRGQRLGRVSDNFGPDIPAHSTTFHLHYELRAATGLVLPPYATLVDSYRRLLAGNP